MSTQYIITKTFVSTVIEFNYQNLQLIHNIFNSMVYSKLCVYLPNKFIDKYNIDDIVTSFYRDDNDDNPNELILMNITTEHEFNELDKTITTILHSKGLPRSINTIINTELTFAIPISTVGKGITGLNISDRKDQILCMLPDISITMNDCISNLTRWKKVLSNAGVHEKNIKIMPQLSLETY